MILLMLAIMLLFVIGISISDSPEPRKDAQLCEVLQTSTKESALVWLV